MSKDAEDGSSSIDTVYVIAMSLLSAVATVGNLVVVVAVVRSPSLRTQLTNFFVINLCVVDLVAATVVMPMSLRVSARSSAVPNVTMSDIITVRSAHCTAFRVLSTFVVFASVLSVALANVERYVSIRYPMQHAAHLTCDRTLIAIASVWVTALAVAATPVVAEWDVLDTGSQCCDGVASSTPRAAAAFVVVVLALLFVSPTLMMAAMCCSIYRVARQASRRVAPGIDDGHGGNAEPPPERAPHLSPSASSCSVKCPTANDIRRHRDGARCQRGSMDAGKVIQVHPATPSLPAARSAPECIIRITCHEDDVSRSVAPANRQSGTQTPTRVVEAQLSAGVAADRRWKAAATLLFILMTFVPLWSFYFAYSLYHAVQRTQQTPDCGSVASTEYYVEKAVVWIGFATFASNAFVYGWMNRAIRDALRDNVDEPCGHCKRGRTRLSEVMGAGDSEDFFQFLERTSNFDRGQLSMASIELPAVNQTLP